MTQPPASSETLIFRSDLFTVADRRQRGPKGGWGPEMGGFPRRIVLTRHGVYACVAGQEVVITDPLNAKYYDGEHSFRFQRLSDGEDLTVIQPDEPIVEEAFSAFGYQRNITPELYLAHMRLYSRLKDGSCDSLEGDEALLDLLHAVVTAGFGGREPPSLNPSTRRRLDNARAFIAAEPEADHRLSEVAAIAGVSPFHFARLFKAHTGHSLRAYRLRLRLAKAVAQMSRGEDDLAGLATDAGFSHQSHMTAAFRKLLGATPDTVRRSLRSLH